MNQDPVVQGNGNVFQANNGVVEGETLTILGKVIAVKEQPLSESDVQKHNFAMLVIDAIAMIGIERFTGQLQDMGAFQNQVGYAQGDFGAVQSGLAQFEQNTYWNGSNAYFLNDLKSNFDQLTKFSEAVYTLFDNKPVVGFNPSNPVSGFGSQTPKWNQIILEIPTPGGGHTSIQPFVPKTGEPNGPAWTLVNHFINSLNGYMFSGSSGGETLPTSVMPGSDTHMPVYIAMALAQLQVKIDSYSSYMTDAQGHLLPKYEEMFSDRKLLNFLFGSFDTDMPLAAVQGFASLLQSNYTKTSQSLLSILINTANDTKPFNPQDILQPFADMMADYMEEKYGTKSSGALPAGGTISGITGSVNNYDSVSLFSNLNLTVQQGSAQLNTQTQNNSAKAQLFASEVNSYDSIGQSVIKAVQQSQKVMTQAQTVS